MIRIDYITWISTRGGKQNSIVKSCMYDQVPQDSQKAKELLKKKFGNKQKIMESMMQRASQWPEIKPEDGEDLHRYSTFITELYNMSIDLDMQMEVNHTQKCEDGDWKITLQAERQVEK